MKFGIGFVLSFIHVIALSTVASQVAQDRHWHWALAFLAWAVGGLIGMVPIVRAFVLIGLVFASLPWQKAIWFGPLMVAICAVAQIIGTALLQRDKFQREGL